MNEKELATLRTEMVVAIDKLPQRNYIDDADVQVWVDTVLRQEPDRAWWHYNRLFGIGGSEIGVLLGAEEGKFHPFSSAKDITQQKLMRQGLSTPNGDMARGTHMEVTARDLYRARVESRGGHAILDDALAAKLGAFKDPDHPWLVGNPDDIVVENGKTYIVDYKVPMPDQIKHYDYEGVPFYYEAQLHHYKLIAEKIGMKIDGLRLASLDLKQWDIDERDVPVRPSLSQQILDVGDHYWNRFVLAGRVAPMVRLTKTTSLDEMAVEIVPELADPVTGEAQIVTFADLQRNTEKVAENGRTVPTGVMDVSSEALRTHVKMLTEKFQAWRNTAIAIGEMSDMFGEAIAQTLPVSLIPHDVDQIDAGGTQLKITRVWDEEAVVDAIRRLGVQAGNTAEAIDGDLQGPNFLGDPTFNQKKLINLIKKHLEVDISSDARFASAIDKEPARRMDTLISLLRDLDVTDEVDWESLLKSKPVISPMLTREPFTGPLNDLRKEFREGIIQEIGPSINNAGVLVAEQRAEVKKQLDAAKPPKKVRKPKV